MNETTKGSAWAGAERRRPAEAPRFAELLMERPWRPTDKPLEATEGWLRANGYAPDRRSHS